jgi:hypothetical protein
MSDGRYVQVLKGWQLLANREHKLPSTSWQSTPTDVEVLQLAAGRQGFKSHSSSGRKVPIRPQSVRQAQVCQLLHVCQLVQQLCCPRSVASRDASVKCDVLQLRLASYGAWLFLTQGHSLICLYNTAPDV